MDIRRPSIEARDAYVASLSSAWRTPVAQSQAPAPRQLTNSRQTDAADPKPEDAQAKRDAAYREYSASLGNAWKSVPAQNTLRAAPAIERLREQTAGK
jgi:hypothetical protein